VPLPVHALRQREGGGEGKGDREGKKERTGQFSVVVSLGGREADTFNTLTHLHTQSYSVSLLLTLSLSLARAHAHARALFPPHPPSE